MTNLKKHDARIAAILGDNEESSFEDDLEKFFSHLRRSLKLPCEVTGSEDFDWEEFYVLGPGDPKEYKRLCKTQPSFRDTFELLAIENDGRSEWMMFHGDFAGHVRRKSDGKEFYLGLAEIKAVDRKSANFQLLEDYGIWFVNNR